MEKKKSLKGLRVLLSILFFVPILLFFADFPSLLPGCIHRLLHIQLIPALLGGMAGIVAAQLLLALLFGRIYCSSVCPAGILQDIINRLFCLGKKGRKRSRRFRYRKPANVLRYALLGITALLAAAGINGLCLLLDPYSNFGRIAAGLFRPAVMWGNNLLADLLMKADNYSLYHVTISTVTAAGLAAAIAALLLFTGMTLLHGRLFCNTLCPAGALLSLVSRHALFRITFDKESCVHCGNCEHACKAEAIDSRTLTLDTSRCVACFNCVSSCAKGGLQYRLRLPGRPVGKTSPHTGKADGRRAFLATGVTVAASLPVFPALAQRGKNSKEMNRITEEVSRWSPLTPPGSVSIERFKDKCTGCQICVVRCPSQVLRPAGLEYGFDFLLKPHPVYISSYCNYECRVCSEVCPTGAIRPLTAEEKKTTQVGVATFFREICVVYTKNQDCGACSEHCPTQAVHMVPYKGTLTIPEVDPALCIGCGGCESICPVRPTHAIMVKPNEIHRHVEKPEEEEAEEIVVDDFGF